MNLKKQSLFLFFTFFCITVFGQMNRTYEDWFFGLHGGTNSLWGDVTDNENHFIPGGPFQQGFYQDRKFMWGFSFGKNLSPAYGIKGQAIFGDITSHTISEKQFMVGTIQDFTVSFTADFLDLFDWAPKSNFDFYGFVGLGFCRFRSQLHSSIINDTLNEPLLNYSPNDPAKYSQNKYTATISVPFGLGLNYKLGKSWVFNVESSVRYLNTDWLDALVSSKRSFEGFGFLSFGVSYHFDMPRGGSTWARKTSHGFDSQKDNTGAAYRNKRTNGSVSTDPFKNIGNNKSSIKVKSKRKKKTFKTPK